MKSINLLGIYGGGKYFWHWRILGLAFFAAIVLFFGFKANMSKPAVKAACSVVGLVPSGPQTIASDTGSVTLSWTAVPGASSYSVRLDDGTSDRYDDTRYTTCATPSPHYYCEDKITANSISNIPVKAGRTYNFWVDAATTEACSGITSFTVSKLTLEDTIRPALGTNIGTGFSNVGSTSFGSTDKISLSSFFYWYDMTQRNPGGYFEYYNQGSLTTHPVTVSYYGSPDYSWKSVSWWEKELKDVADAGIDVILLVYWGFPDSRWDSTFSAQWSNGGLPNMVTAMNNLSSQEPFVSGRMKIPKVGMFYDTSTLLKDINPLGRSKSLDLRTDDKVYFWGTIRDFWSQIPTKYWAQIDNKPLIYTYYLEGPTAGYNQASIDYVKTLFSQSFGGKVPFMILEQTTGYNYLIYNGSSGTMSTKGSGGNFAVGDGYYDWMSAWQPDGVVINDVPQVSPGYDDTGTTYAYGGPRPTATVYAREGGAKYLRAWDRAIAAGKNIISIGTWNELWESTDIIQSKEFGRSYIYWSNAKKNQWLGKRSEAAYASAGSAAPPLTMAPGQTAQVSVKMTNSGASSWRSGSGFFLGSVGDNASWGNTRIPLDINETILPGESKTFSFSITAPQAPGTYSYQWKMVQEYVEWFGTATAPFSISVQPAPNVDTVPPVISGTAVFEVKATSTTVTWTTNEASDSQVDYGLTLSYGASSPLNTSMLVSHSVMLSNLTPSILYHYRVKSKDASGNQGMSADQTFTTASVPSSTPTPTPALASDTQAPSIPVGIAAEAYAPTQINLSWSASSDPAVSGQVTSGLAGYRIYRCPGLGCSATAQIAQTVSANYSDTSVASSAPYSYRIRAIDNAGNLSNYSTTVTVTTPAPTPIPGDFNGDGIVNSLDYSLLSRKWNQTSNIATYDLKPDGIINTLDYGLFLSNWGRRL